MISVKDHGAIPDPAADNTAAIQAAINATAISTETRTVIVPPGVWGSRHVTVPAGVTLMGDGGTLRHLPTTANESLVEIVGDDATILRLGIDGNRANQTFETYGILVQGNRSNLERVHVKETNSTGILVSGRTGHQIERCRVYGTGKNGIGFTAPSSMVVATDFTISGCHTERTNDGGIAVWGTNFDVIGNTTRDTGGDGITAYAGENGYYSLIGNTMTGISNNGIHSAGPGATIVGNTIRECLNRGIYHLASDLSTQDGVAISSNYVRNTGLDGYEVRAARNLTMTGNVMIGSAMSAYHLREVDGLALAANIADKITSHGYKFMAVRHVSGSGNVGTGIGGDLIHVEDAGVLPQSLNGIFSGNVGNGIGRAVNLVDTASWFTETGTMHGATALPPFNMGSATNRRI